MRGCPLAATLDFVNGIPRDPRRDAYVAKSSPRPVLTPSGASPIIPRRCVHAG
jgi:hypothetical protein